MVFDFQNLPVAGTMTIYPDYVFGAPPAGTSSLPGQGGSQAIIKIKGSQQPTINVAGS